MKNVQEISEIPAGVPVFLYGASRGGQIVRKALKGNKGVQVAGFIDTYKSGEVDGLPVMPLESFAKDRPANALVVITSQYFFEISMQLRRHGITECINAHPLVMRLIEAEGRRKRLTVLGGMALVVVAGLWLMLR